MNYKRITKPLLEPVTLDQAKEQLRVLHNAEDSLITGYIQAARKLCEDKQAKAYLTQKWIMVFDQLPKFPLDIPRPPLQAIDSFTIKALDGTIYTVSPENFAVDTDSEPGRFMLKPDVTLPSVALYPVGAVKLEFTAGYQSAESIEEEIRQAILLIVAYWYKHREAANDRIPKEVELSVTALLANGRQY